MDENAVTDGPPDQGLAVVRRERPATVDRVEEEAVRAPDHRGAARPLPAGLGDRAGRRRALGRPAVPAPGEPAPPAPAPAASVTEDGRLKVGDYELSSDDIASLMRTRAEQDLRAAAVPADGNYQAKLPDGFKMPEGLTGEFVFNEADPAFVDLKRWARVRSANILGAHFVLCEFRSAEGSRV